MEKDVLVQKERGFIEKFMVPQMYDLFRFGGSSVKDDEMGMQRMLQNFSGLFTQKHGKVQPAEDVRGGKGIFQKGIWICG